MNLLQYMPVRKHMNHDRADEKNRTMNKSIVQSHQFLTAKVNVGLLSALYLFNVLFNLMYNINENNLNKWYY